MVKICVLKDQIFYMYVINSEIQEDESKVDESFLVSAQKLIINWVRLKKSCLFSYLRFYRQVDLGVFQLSLFCNKLR